MAQHDPDAKVGSYSDGMFFDFISMINLYPAPADRVSAEELFEEEDDPDAAFDETVNSDFNTPHSPLSYTLKLPDASTIAQGTGEHSESQQPLAFGNNSNIDGKPSTRLSYSSSCTYILGGSASVGYNYCSEVQNMSFVDLLADNGNNFDFAFDNFDFINNSSNADGHQWPYRTAATNSSGEDCLLYDDRDISSATYSSSEGDGYSIYSDWNNTDIELNADMIHMNDTDNYSNIILPTPRILTSPPSSPAQPSSVNNNLIYNLSKRPRSPVAADLDTANILPLEHRRKRIKPARVRE